MNLIKYFYQPIKKLQQWFDDILSLIKANLR